MAVEAAASICCRPANICEVPLPTANGRCWHRDLESAPQNQACCALRCAAPAVQVPEGFFDYCKENSIPVLGICYGMQVGCGAQGGPCC